jgi:hypothetical protein
MDLSVNPLSASTRTKSVGGGDRWRRQRNSQQTLRKKKNVALGFFSLNDTLFSQGKPPYLENSLSKALPVSEVLGVKVHIRNICLKNFKIQYYKSGSIEHDKNSLKKHQINKTK